MSSKKWPSSEKTADKAIVSFNSDSDEDDSSASSKLSSPASSDDSDAENATSTLTSSAKKSEAKAVDSKDQKRTQVSSRAAESSSGTMRSALEQRKPDATKDKVVDKDADKISTSAKSRLSPKLNVSESVDSGNKERSSIKTKELRLSPGKLNDDNDEASDAVKASKNKVRSDRSKSPKITIEDIDEGRKGDDDTTMTKKKTSKGDSVGKTLKNSTEEDGVQVPIKVSKDDDTKSLITGKDDDLARSSKRSSKVTAASDDRDKSPGSSTSDARNSKAGNPRSEDREKSPRKTSSEKKEIEREKSPKSSSKELEVLNSPEKSPARTTKQSKTSSALEEKLENLEKRLEAEVRDSSEMLSTDSRVKSKKNAKKAPENASKGEAMAKEENVTAVKSKPEEVALTKESVSGISEVDSKGSTGDEKKELGDWKKFHLEPAESGGDIIRNQKEGERKDVELVNEDSDFTYRRKSMDEFIKRILAEAREEKLKQKQGKPSGTENSADEIRKTDVLAGYGERNGDLDDAESLENARWNKTDNKHESTLDRRLANIEKRKQAEAATTATVNGGLNDGERSKFSRDHLEENETNKTKSNKDAKDYDINLDDDLEEINRFLQSRKSAASRFNFDDSELANDSAAPTKSRWLTSDKDSNQQRQQVDDEDVASQDSSRTGRKKFSVDLDFNDEDERFLGRFKRDRDSSLPDDSFAPRRRDETNQIVREKTRNVRVLVDHQVEIIQAMRNTSKGLDELEKEIREVRQVCLDRRARISALEGAIDAECRVFENDQLAASGRQQQTLMAGEMMRDDLAYGRLRRQDRVKSESLDEENFPFRRRSGSVASNSSFSSGFAAGRVAATDVLNDFRPPRAPDFRRTESESDYPLERRRGGSVSRNGGVGGSGDGPSGGPEDGVLGQRPARSRASIATSTPAIDFSGTSTSGDSFLTKIRSKYSFLAPSPSPSSSIGSAGGDVYSFPPPRNPGLGSSSYTTPSLDSRYGRQFSIEQTKQRVKEILSSSPYGTTGRYGGGRYSITDSQSSGYGGSGGGFASSSFLDSNRMRRAQSVSETSFERPSASPTLLHSVYSTSGSSSSGQFHSRFLDKVRDKKAMGEDPSATKNDQEKPFKSRFLKTTTSFDAPGSSLRADRLANGFENASTTNKVDGSNPTENSSANEN